jgi:NAD(P)-dependent dehydrogenase (short-subunit alcohol dehydrogenase family)
MSNKIAVVTGGSLGLGREVARGLQQRGYRVAIFGRSQTALDQAVADIGGDIFATSVDVADENSVADGFARVDEALGPTGTLVNVAAIFQPFGIEDATAERVMPMINTNFCGAVYTMRQAVQRMRLLGGGDIVNVSSESVRQSTPFYSIYTASKAALENFTRIMGEELREDGIRCTTFRVGRMHSHGAATVNFDPDFQKRFVDRCVLTGAGYWTGAGMQPQSAALALVNLLETPRDARVELIEVRSH